MKQTFNFPYFGAGKASYYEWAEVQVIFKKEPTKAQKKQIEKNVPFPILDIDWEGEFMTAGSKRFVHCDIAETYQTKDGLDPEDKENWEEDFFFAAGSQINAFNEDIERWLYEIHKISPILLAYRDEDYESEGTVFSNWNKWSLKQFKSISPYFNAVVTDFDYKSTKARILFNIFHLLKIEDFLELDNKYIKYRYPGNIEFESFEKGNIEPLKHISNSNYAEKAILLFIKNSNEKHAELIIKHTDILLSFETKISEKTFQKLNGVIFTYIDVDSEYFKKVAENIADIYIVDKIAEKAYSLMRSGKYKESIKLFEKILLTPTAEPNTATGFYTNALWVFQKDNTGFPVNKKLNKLALEKCIPKGAEYPAIFFNACCIYTEMEEYDNAYEMVEKAIAHHYDKKFMINEIKTEDMFKDFRTKTDILNLLKNDKLEPKENPKPRFINESIAYGQFDVHTIYNRGYAINFSSVLLINGNVTISGEFTAIYKTLIGENKTIQHGNIINGIRTTEEKKEETLVIVNGNLTAKSISDDKDVYILVMGKISCKNITHQEVIEKGNTNFDYIVHKPKKYTQNAST